MWKIGKKKKEKISKEKRNILNTPRTVAVVACCLAACALSLMSSKMLDSKDFSVDWLDPDAEVRPHAPHPPLMP